MEIAGAATQRLTIRTPYMIENNIETSHPSAGIRPSLPPGQGSYQDGLWSSSTASPAPVQCDPPRAAPQCSDAHMGSMVATLQGTPACDDFMTEMASESSEKNFPTSLTCPCFKEVPQLADYECFMAPCDFDFASYGLEWAEHFSLADSYNYCVNWEPTPTCQDDNQTLGVLLGVDCAYVKENNYCPYDNPQYTGADTELCPISCEHGCAVSSVGRRLLPIEEASTAQAETPSKAAGDGRRRLRLALAERKMSVEWSGAEGELRKMVLGRETTTVL